MQLKNISLWTTKPGMAEYLLRVYEKNVKKHRVRRVYFKSSFCFLSWGEIDQAGVGKASFVKYEIYTTGTSETSFFMQMIIVDLPC